MSDNNIDGLTGKKDHYISSDKYYLKNSQNQLYFNYLI